jgi:hypothetical protein
VYLSVSFFFYQIFFPYNQMWGKQRNLNKGCSVFNYVAEHPLSLLTTQTPERSERGNRMKGVVNGKTTYYLGKLYEKTVSGSDVTVQKYYTTGSAQIAVVTVKKYYTTGSAQIAVVTVKNGTSTLQWLLNDNINSTSVTANADGTWNSTIQYSAFGEIWASSGITGTEYRYIAKHPGAQGVGQANCARRNWACTITWPDGAQAPPTAASGTGQLRQAELGLYYYVARWRASAPERSEWGMTPLPGTSSRRTRWCRMRSAPRRLTGTAMWRIIQ